MVKGLCILFSLALAVGTHAQPNSKLMQNTYVVSADMLLVRVDQPAQPLSVRAGTTVTIIERHDGYARLGFDSEEGSALPSDVWVRWTPELRATLQPAPLDHTAYCYRNVKRYLISIGKVDTYLPGSYAAEAYHILPEYGFHNTGSSPENASEGDVCVYSGGPQGYGHIEVLRSKGWWYGYGYSDHPMRNRHFLGCFRK